MRKSKLSHEETIKSRVEDIQQDVHEPVVSQGNVCAKMFVKVCVIFLF